MEYAEKLQELQKALDIDEHRILKYCSVRFLSMYPVVNWLLEQFQALKQLFIEDIPQNNPKVSKQPRSQRISEAIKCKFTLPSLYFIQFSLEIFQKYEKLFQRTSPTIHIMYSKQVELFRNTLLQFCRFELIEKIDNDKDLIHFDFKEKKNILPTEKINIGIKAKECISKFTNNEKIVFLEGVKQYYLKLCKHLLKNLSLSNLFLSNLEFLNPLSRTIENEKKILYCAKKLPPGANIGHKEIDALSTEWKNLVLENIPKDWFTDEDQKYKPLDTYWCRIFSIKDNNNELKYPIISKVVKSCFAIAEANADVERLFSQITHIIQKERNRLNLDTVKGILHSKEVCHDAEIDDQLIYNVKAASARYRANFSLQQDNNNITLKRKLEQEVQEKYKKDERLKKIEGEENILKENQEELKLTQAKALLKMKEAQDLMEKAQKIYKIIANKKQDLEKKKSKVEKSILKSTCQKAAKNLKDFLNKPSTSNSGDFM